MLQLITTSYVPRVNQLILCLYKSNCNFNIFLIRVKTCLITLLNNCRNCKVQEYFPNFLCRPSHLCVHVLKLSFYKKYNLPHLFCQIFHHFDSTKFVESISSSTLKFPLIFPSRSLYQIRLVVFASLAIQRYII